ncbi:hypothetical protein B296_00026162 [Ensete ventricosum]|uniref:Secreted protein n=1 Tax=Ensete ventricosum TaxID=4639 RepID=A0A426YR11_ENSVE|nr:hypothetical protein B296_00026162 [Ensete ventricosum]
MLTIAWLGALTPSLASFASSARFTIVVTADSPVLFPTTSSEAIKPYRQFGSARSEEPEAEAMGVEDRGLGFSSRTVPFLRGSSRNASFVPVERRWVPKKRACNATYPVLTAARKRPSRTDSRKRNHFTKLLL